MGLRLGGLLLATAAQNQTINRLVLWDLLLKRRGLPKVAGR